MECNNAHCDMRCTGYLRHGMALKALGRFNEAIVSLRKGRQVDPKYTKIRDVIAEVRAQSVNISTAVVFLPY